MQVRILPSVFCSKIFSLIEWSAPIFFLNCNPFFSHPLDQFEIFALFFLLIRYKYACWFICYYKFNRNSLFKCISNSFYVFWQFLIRGNFNVWEFLMREIYDLVKSIVKSNTSLKRNQYFSILFFYLFLF